MKRNALLLILISLLFLSTTQAEEKWLKDKNGCYLWVESSAKKVVQSVSWLGQCKNGYASAAIPAGV